MRLDRESRASDSHPERKVPAQPDDVPRGFVLGADPHRAADPCEELDG
jgi:hypothetical protein